MLCPLCTYGVCVTPESYISHLNVFHIGRKNVNLSCPIGGLQWCKNFKSVAAVVRHYYKWHHQGKPPPASPGQSPNHHQPSAAVVAEPSLTSPQSTQSLASAGVLLPDSPSVSTSSHFSKSAAVLSQEERINTEHIQDQLNIDQVSTNTTDENNKPEASVPTTASLPQDKAVSSTIDGDSDDEDYEDVSDDDGDDEVAAALRKETPKNNIDISHVNSNAADLLLYLKSKCTVPQSAIDGVREKCENLVRHQILKFVDSISPALAEKNVDIKNIINVQETVDSCSKVFEGINSKWKQDKYFEKKFNIVKPLRFFVGHKIQRKRNRKTGRRQNVLTQNSVIFNRISKFLEKLQSHPDFEKVTDPALFNEDPDILDSFTKSVRYKISEFFKKHPKALRLVLYYDEFDSCDAIASKTGVHKLGAFYLGVDNIHPKYRSNLDFISLVALCNASTIKDVGMDIIIKPILKELKKLEKGIVLESGEVLRASLIATIGDNLGIHALCGFKEGFTARRTCHHCMAEPEELHTLTTENEALLRTVPMYEDQIMKMKSAKTKKNKEELSTEFGLNRECSLNELDSYHVIGSIVADIMHDQMEGCLQLQLRKLFHHVTSGDAPLITLEWLNEALADFDFEYSEVVNKPSIIRKSHLEEKDGKLHQNSSQTYQLAMFLPLVLGPHVSEDNLHWENYLLLIQICKIIFAHEIHVTEIDELADMIELYLSSYQELYGDLIPKQHFMVHYPRLIRFNGPLTLYSCMRMEAFHRNFKRKAYSLGNYINIEVSLSNSYALDQAVLLSGSLIPVMKYGPVTKMKLQERPYKHLIAGSEYIVESTWMKDSGITMIRDRCFIIYGCHEFMPLFALVKHIIVWPEPVLICQVAKTMSFFQHFNAYEINLQDSLRAVKPSQMLGHAVFHSHNALSKLWIVTKYSINGCF